MLDSLHLIPGLTVFRPADGIHARVVSVPYLELLNQQPDSCIVFDRGEERANLVLATSL